MALGMDIKYKGLDVKGAYHKIDTLEIEKFMVYGPDPEKPYEGESKNYQCKFSISVYTDSTKSQLLIAQDNHVCTSSEDTITFASCYEYLKTLDMFAKATDV